LEISTFCKVIFQKHFYRIGAHDTLVLDSRTNPPDYPDKPDYPAKTRPSVGPESTHDVVEVVLVAEDGQDGGATADVFGDLGAVHQKVGQAQVACNLAKK
jgi:hypothetical protein